MSLLENLLKEQAKAVRKVDPKPRKKHTLDLPGTSLFRCCTPGCGETFTTQAASERHEHARIESVLAMEPLAR